jgi:hypothetical protein
LQLNIRNLKAAKTCACQKIIAPRFGHFSFLLDQKCVVICSDISITNAQGPKLNTSCKLGTRGFYLLRAELITFIAASQDGHKDTGRICTSTATNSPTGTRKPSTSPASTASATTWANRATSSASTPEINGELKKFQDFIRPSSICLFLFALLLSSCSDCSGEDRYSCLTMKKRANNVVELKMSESLNTKSVLFKTFISLLSSTFFYFNLDAGQFRFKQDPGWRVGGRRSARRLLCLFLPVEYTESSLKFRLYILSAMRKVYTETRIPSISLSHREGPRPRLALAFDGRGFLFQ